MIIYALTDSNGAWRYIGKTEKPLARRLRSHMSEARRGVRRHVYNWIRSLESAPGALEVERCGSPEELEAAEMEWIAEARRLGVRLTNATDGGEGSAGRKIGADTREKMSAAKRGRPSPPQSAESRERTAAFHRGRKRSPETCARIGASRLGKPGRKLTDDQRSALRAAIESPIANARRLANLRARLIGSHHSDETRTRMKKPHAIKNSEAYSEARRVGMQKYWASVKAETRSYSKKAA